MNCRDGKAMAAVLRSTGLSGIFIHRYSRGAVGKGEESLSAAAAVRWGGLPPQGVPQCPIAGYIDIRRTLGRG